MKSTSKIEALKAQRNDYVQRSIKAAKRGHMKAWEKWCDKANAAIEALAVLFSHQKASK